ncbi:MAG: lysophospholipid acyltransferase family protein, partial [Kiritimatiellaeota bacterium]|nr:lysophospholipid acyltransferase family protein [Kiritimatiellota bacterium]
MKVPRSERIFSIDPKGVPFPFRSTLTCWLVERFLALDKLEDIYQTAKPAADERSFSVTLLETMGVTWKVSPETLAAIPKTGPVVVVANHPFGGVEGVVLDAILRTARQDTKILANYILGRIPEMRDHFILVNPFGTSAASQMNIRPLLDCLKWVTQDHGMLGVFPSGEVSSIDLKTGLVRDPAWSVTIGKIVRKSKATVVPVFFGGHNGPFFQLMGLLHPRFRTMMLPSMLDNKKNRELEVHVGAPIPWADLEKYGDDATLVNYLRLRTYALGGRDGAEEKRHRSVGAMLRKLLPRRKKKRAPQEPLIAPVPTERLEADIRALPESCRLLTAGEVEVYMAKALALPNVLREIGRLRELTFRGVGEGTGRPIDVDIYDQHYHHLFTWNAAKKEVIGAYRLGLADEIVRDYGVEGLYTHSLFKFDRRLIEQLQPCIEMGRSFVRPEYQRSFSSLLLLWKGIGAWIAKHPEYATLFGPVSISNEYRDQSRNMILRSLSLSNFASDLARLVRPRNPPKRIVKAEWNLETFNPYISDVGNVSAIVQDIEEDKKGIPILLRQYLKLGGKLLAFNLDEAFSSVVAGL